MAIIPRPSTPPLICVQSSERKLPDWAKQEFIHLVQQLHQHQERLHQVHQQTTSSSMMDQVDLNMNLNPFFHSKSTWTPHAPSFLSFSTPLQEKNHSEYSFLHAHASPPSWTTSTLTSTTTYKPSSPMETELRYYLHEPKAVIALLCTHDPFQVAMAIQMLPFLQIMFLDEQDLEFSQAQLVVRHYLKHPTPFVRLAAIQALLTLHRLFGVRYLDSSIYPFFTPCLSDDNPQVRKKAIPLARLCGLMFPGHSVKHVQSVLPNTNACSETIMCDISEDVFIRLCDLVNDPHFEIRQCATLELGNFGNISTELLLQTLSKKALGISKKEGRDSILSKEWKSHAGAFVHAIEDEFQVVRQAALDSISRLGAKHKNFALGAVYFLIDMTNDEMHQIRKNALKVLCQISAAYDVILTPLDLDDLNEVFHDIDPFVRYDLYTFLGAIRCSNNLVLTNMIRALRINLNLFKEDIQSIFKCVRKIAERNHDFVEMEALKILKINPKFIQREERPDDIHYACKLILVWNAAFSQPNIHTYLPKFMLKQIPFLSQRYPDAFPPPQWKTLLSKIEDSETSLIQYVTHQLMSITMETQRTTLYEMVMRVRQQCSTSPSSHLSFLLDLADLFFLAHDISYEKVGPKNANHLQQAIQRIQTVYQVEFHSSSTSSLSPGLQTPFTSMAASFSDSFSSIVDSIRTFPFTSISHVFKRQVKLDSPQANSEHQPHSVSNHFTFACELHLSPTMPSLWACITWPDASKEWMSLPVLPCPTIHVPPRSWSDVSSVQIQVGQFASSLPLMDEPSSFNSSKNTFVPLSNSISLWFRYSLLM